jgi:hypothetical protein
VDSNSVTLLAALLGAVVGGPAGFFVERLVNRPRLRINYAETAYEDIYAFPGKITQNLLRETSFIDFVATQVTWSFKQRLTSGLFNREELRLLNDFAQQYMDWQSQATAKFENEFLPVLNKKGPEIEALVPELEGNYLQAYSGANLNEDLKSDREGTIARLVALCSLSRARTQLSHGWLDEFRKQIQVFLKQPHGTSDRVIVRISLGNSGYQSAIAKTEGRLGTGGRTFRTPLQTASRPWESTGSQGPSQFYVVQAKSFLVLEFLVDENLNAPADLNALKQNLQLGADATFSLVDIAGDTAASLKFHGVLR